MKVIAVIFAVICAAYGQSYSCPDAQLISPCTCKSQSSFSSSVTFTCSGDQSINLSQIFNRMTLEKTYSLNKLVISNTALTELIPEVFGGVNFYNVDIEGASKLTKISPYAFSSPQTQLSVLTIKNTPLSGNETSESDIFDAFSHLTNLNTLTVQGSSITEIPEKAFTVKIGIQSNLYTVNFSRIDDKTRGSLTSIGKKAFYELPYLQTIDLSGNNISKVANSAFATRSPSSSTGTTTINLEDNALDGETSFTFGSFSLLDRNVNLKLGSNPSLKYLDEEVFSPFLEDGSYTNTIDLDGSKLTCDCKMFWLYQSKDSLSSKVKNAVCSDGTNFFDLPASKFSNCD